MEHPDEGVIHAWLDGALPDDEAAALEAHVVACDSCSAAAADARGLIAASSRIVSALDDVPGDVIPGVIPRDVIARDAGRTVSRDVIPIGQPMGNAPRRVRSWWQQRGIAAAALLVVVAGSAVLTMPGRGPLMSSDAAPESSAGAAAAPASSAASASPTPSELGTAMDEAKERERAERAPGQAAPAPVAVMSAPAGRPATAAAPRATSPVVDQAATRRGALADGTVGNAAGGGSVAAGGMAGGVAGGMAGGVAGGMAGGVAGGVASGSAGGGRTAASGAGVTVATTDLRAEFRTDSRGVPPAGNVAGAADASRANAAARAMAIDSSSVRAVVTASAASAAAASAATGASARTAPAAPPAPTPPAVASARERTASGASSAPSAPTLRASPRAMQQSDPASLAGCYTLTPVTNSAAIARILPRSVRLTDSLLSSERLYLARAIESGGPDTRLLWRPSGATELLLHVITGGARTELRVRLAGEKEAEGQARRAGC